MKSIPPIVDENGDINLHGRQGAVITVKFTDDNGNPDNVSAKAMTFECGPNLNINLTAGSTNDEKTLTLSNADVKTIYGLTDKQFVVMDNSGAVPLPRWIGKVFIMGWVE